MDGPGGRERGGENGMMAEAQTKSSIRAPNTIIFSKAHGSIFGVWKSNSGVSWSSGISIWGFADLDFYERARIWQSGELERGWLAAVGCGLPLSLVYFYSFMFLLEGTGLC